MATEALRIVGRLPDLFPCTCHNGYTARNLIAPDCVHHDLI